MQERVLKHVDTLIERYPELGVCRDSIINAYEIMKETDGIYGGRFSGAGFKGCCMALIDPRKASSIAEQVERRYLDAYPEMRGRYSFHLCASEDGIGAGL